MADTAQPLAAAETEAVDPIAAAADAFKSFDRSAPETPERPRGPDGKFVSTAEQPAEEIEAEETEQSAPEAESHDEEPTAEAAEEAQPEPVDLPTSWPAEHAETWQSLPPETQAIIAEREGQRDAAVNAKFQEAANLRKANEAEINEAKANRQRFAEAADFLLSVVQPQKPPATMLDPNSSDYNPDAYHLASRRYEEQAALLQNVAQQRAQLAQQEQAEAQKAREARIAEINDKAMPELVKLVPEFSDPAKAQPAFLELAQYALAQGVPQETELSAFTAVELSLLAKARKYDEMMAAKAKVQPKAPKPAAPVVRPGVATPKSAVEQQQRKKAFERLDREGSVEAGAAAFAALTRK
jgi:hypothetical protein